VLLISCTSEQTPYSIPVDEHYYTPDGRLRIKKSAAIKTIMRVANWRHDAMYAVTGAYVPALNMVAFILSDEAEWEAESGE